MTIARDDCSNRNGRNPDSGPAKQDKTLHILSVVKLSQSADERQHRRQPWTPDAVVRHINLRGDLGHVGWRPLGTHERRRRRRGAKGGRQRLHHADGQCLPAMRTGIRHVCYVRVTIRAVNIDGHAGSLPSSDAGLPCPTPGQWRRGGFNAFSGLYKPVEWPTSCCAQAAETRHPGG